MASRRKSAGGLLTERSVEAPRVYIETSVWGMTLENQPRAKKLDDARHVAIATLAGLEIVVSWNHRHMANERKRSLFNAVNRLAGFDQVLMIHTPFEVMQ